MSKMGNHLINTAADRAASDADEVAWLRHEVTRLEGVIARAAAMLDEGDPMGVLVGMAHTLGLFGAELDAATLNEVAATMARARDLLAGACP